MEGSRSVRAGNRRLPALAVLFLAGAVAALGHSPLSFPPATVAGFAVAIRILSGSASPAGAARGGWLFAAGYFLVLMIWLVEPFLVFPLRHGWLAPIALSTMAGGLALFWGLAFGAAHAMGTGVRSRGLALAIMLTGVEAFREFALTGFPWGLPGFIWSATPVAQLAAHVGPLGLTFLTLLAAAAIVGANRLWLGALIAVAGIGAAWAVGAVRLAEQDGAAGERPVVRLVQPNAEQALKWDPLHVERFHRRLLDLTAAESDRPPDITVWPETAVTFLLGAGKEDLDGIASAAAGRTVVGTRRLSGTAVHNSMAVISPDGGLEAVYDKRKLVPFGEYVPMGDFLASLGFSGLATDETGAFSPGTGPAVIRIPPLGRVLAVICYEAIFWSRLRREERPDAMIQITNDAWFGTFSGPQQHFEQARMRAIELGVPLIRVANTGISGVIDGKGRVVGQLGLGAQGHLDLEVPVPLPATAFVRFGHVPLLIVAAILLGLIGWRRWAIRR